jgi:phosphoglycerate dehydrogenase-like enzyme
VTVDSYPLAEPGKGASLARVKIVAWGDIPEPHQGRLRGLSPNLELVQCRSEEEFRREVADAHVIYGEPSREDFAAARQLRWIQYASAGVEPILWPELVESPVVLTNMQRIFSPTISETVIGLLLSLTRGLNRYALQTRERRWQPIEGLTEISGLTMGIAGLGGIGTDTAYRAHYGFQMTILAVDPKPLPKPAFVAELHSLDWLPKMVPQVDVLVCAAPHTPLSEGMFNESIFRAMKPTAYFINVSRGKLVDTPALVRALKEGWIAGAGLDVAYKEPLPPDDPLWTAGNIIVTAHTSGHSEGSNLRARELFLENVRRYMNGLPLLNVVDKRRGY